MPFSDKQEKYLQEATHRWNFKGGATRSGKTFLDFSVVIPKRVVNTTGEGLIVALGNTQGTLERNVFEPMRNIWGSGLVSYISKGTNTMNLFGRRVYALGAEKASSVSKIHGSSIEYCYGDEVPTWNPDVFQMLKSRLDKRNSCFDGTYNPEHPGHWLKKFIDSDADIYNQHYGIDDNPFNDPVFVANLKKEYAGTVYYDRFINGLWIAAEGIVYRLFADNPEQFILDKEPKTQFCTIGIDFGGNKSAHAFNCVGFLPGLSGTVTLDEYHSNKELSPRDLEENAVAFARKQVEAGRNVVEIRCDSAEQVLIRGIRIALLKAGINIPVKNAIKGQINERIRFNSMLMSYGVFFVMRHCVHTIEAYSNALWDAKSLDDKRLDDGTTNIDSLDADEYAKEPFMKQITLVLKGRGN